MQGLHRRPTAPARRSIVALLLVAGISLTGVACGEDSEPQSFSDEEIEKALSLEDVQGTLAVDGDIFCEVRPQFLNDTDEVSEALDRNEGLVLTSIQGNVGIQVVPPFAKDCEAKVRRELKALDPTKQQLRREKQEKREGSGGEGSADDVGSGDDGGGSGGEESGSGDDAASSEDDSG